MANIDERYLDNVAGPFFVDSECIACDTCAGLAPKHFKLVNQNTHAIVYLQPNTDSEYKACTDALATCPVDAIGRIEENQ